MPGFKKQISLFNVAQKLDLTVPSKISKEVAWQRIEQKIRYNKLHSVRIFKLDRKIFKPLIAVAASLILIITIYLTWLPKESKTYITDSGAKYSIFLPDSSEVILNTDTQINYYPEKWEKKRVVELEGEAFFNVKKGSRFLVKTKLGNVKVPGTSFNVLTRGNSFEVSCFTGKVLVKLSNKKVSTILTKGLSTRYLGDDKLSAPEAFNPNQTVQWHNDEFYFTNTPLCKVINELENHYNVSIIIQNINDRYYTGYFPKNDLEKALNLICIPMNIRYRIINESEIEIVNK